MVAGIGGAGKKTETRQGQPIDKTPPDNKINFPKDAREEKGAGKYPYYYTHRTRSGHVITLDDSEDHESITIQHRGGSMLQFMPDGAVYMVSQNGRYSVIFGEDRMEVHGAHELTVHGSATMRVDGDMDTTIMGNHNMTVNGDFNMQAKNFNAQVRGNMEFNTKNTSFKTEGSTEISSHGITDVHGEGGIAINSSSKGVGIKGTEVAIKSSSGDVMIQSAASTDMKMGSTFKIGAGGKMSITAGGGLFSVASPTKFNSGGADEPGDAFVLLSSSA